MLGTDHGFQAEVRDIGILIKAADYLVVGVSEDGLDIALVQLYIWPCITDSVSGVRKVRPAVFGCV